MNIKLRFALTLIVLLVSLNACTQKTQQNEGAVSKDTLSASLPKTLMALAVDMTTLVVEVIVDGGEPQACANLSVNQVDGTYSCDITLSSGPHTLSLVYSINDGLYGTMQVTTTSDININIIAGQTSPADFSVATLTYTDNDGDGISNLVELDEGSNPTELSYYVGGTVNGLLGSDGAIQLNGSSTLNLSGDGRFIITPAVADNSIYTITALTQPNTPDQTCNVTNGAGTVSSENVTDVVVICINNGLPGAPTASNVSITDNNAGKALVGDTLTGSYVYNDVGGDIEGVSIFRWLRNSVAISGAMLSTYTLVVADNGQSIVFEVTPVAVTGTTTGSAVTSSGIMVTTNSVPTASNVRITDDNGGNAIIGERLTGNYNYNDVDGDVEGTSTFRWLRDGLAIDGTTSSTYFLVAADVPAQIIFEVTPVAASGETTGIAITSTALVTGVVPVVSGFARYLDTNMNGISDANDQLIIPFDQNVSASALNVNDFELPVIGDTFGIGATAANGPASNGIEVTITLGNLPSIKTRQDFSNTLTAVNSASGIDVGVLGAPQSKPIDLIPAFVDSLQSLGENDSRSVALGDVDGDGDLDMVVVNSAVVATSSNPPNLVYINDGKGNFADSGQALGTTPGALNRATSVALGDLDGDGDLDMVVSNDFFVPNRVYTNDGAGNFTDSGQNLGANESAFIALGDLDGDGDLDMVVANGRNQRKWDRVYTNDGAGNFTDSGQLLGAGDSTFITLGDVDGDGDLDMVVATYSGLATLVYTNDGTGRFIDSGQALSFTKASSAVALGDLDGDGDLDIVVANDNGDANQIYSNDGTGRFTDSGQLLGTDSSESVALGDVDGDGDLDMVVVNRTTSFNRANRVYINDGTGRFADSGQFLGPSFRSSSIALGDLDGDGDLDMAVANRGVTPNRVYMNSLAGTWGNATFIDSGQTLDVATTQSQFVTLGDLDSDGDLDMVVANRPNKTNRIYVNNSAGIFTKSDQVLGTNDSYAIKLSDIDGDGDLDMAVANDSSQANRIYINDGVGNFTDSGQALGTNNSRSIELGDIDGDGDPDMVVANMGQANRVYVNDGAGSFSDSGQALGTNDSQSIKLGDVDRDGDLDIAVANRSGQANRIYINDGTGRFTDSGQTLGANISYSIKLGDVDGDGDLDMAVVNRNSQANRIYINDGTGRFTDSGQTLGANASEFVVLGDVDGDGDLDMAVANRNSQANRIYINDGTGSFTDSGQTLGANVSFSIELGDVDGDGDLDMVVANFKEVNQVYLNK